MLRWPHTEHTHQLPAVKSAVNAQLPGALPVIQAGAESSRPLRWILRGHIFQKYPPAKLQSRRVLLRGKAADRVYLRAAGQAVQRHILHLAVFHRIAPHRALAGKARLLQRPSGGGIVGKRLGVDAEDIAGLKDDLAKLPDGVGHDAPAPVRLRQIVAQLRRPAVNVFLAKRADAADDPVIHGDGIGECTRFIGVQHRLDVIQGIPLRIGKRQAVPQVIQDLFVVQRGCQLFPV